MRKLLCIIAVLAGALAAQAQTFPSLLVPSDAATLALGGNGVALGPRSFAVENNAAAISLSDQTLSASATYSLWQPSAAKENIIAAGGWWHSGKIGIGASFGRLGMPSYVITSNNGTESQVDAPFSPSDLSFSLGGSFALMENLSVGVTARMVISSLAKEAKAVAPSFGVSAMYKAGGLTAGLTLANLGGKVKYAQDSEGYAQPAVVRAGAAYTIIEGLTAQAEVSYLFAGAFGAAAGVEYGFKDMIFARAGFHYGSASLGLPTYASLGLGAKFAGVTLDAAYLLVGNLSNSLMFTVGYGF